MIHIAIVSHGHENLLIESKLGGLLPFVKTQTDGEQQLKIWVKDNKPSSKLAEFCQQHEVFYTAEMAGLGFGENNNYLFQIIKQNTPIGEHDFFILVNPDITVDAKTLLELTQRMRSDHFPLATLNLYRDAEHKNTDSNIRRFPDIWSIPKIFMARSVSGHYNKATLSQACHIDWASGALLAFDAMHFNRLGGFDPRYFMYFEDVDICYRSYKMLGLSVRYYPDLSAVHLAAHKNRNIISRHANWFFKSFVKFMVRRYFVYDRSASPVAQIRRQDY